MPYANGETPVLGDYVKSDLEEPGTVTRLRMASNGDLLNLGDCPLHRQLSFGCAGEFLYQRTEAGGELLISHKIMQ